MNAYEAMYIIHPAIEEEARKELVERFSSLITANGGTIDSVDEWGKRRLAYPINDLSEGSYVLMKFQANPELPHELERNFLIQESVIRYLVVRQGD